jgi:hypothetical protein
MGLYGMKQIGAAALSAAALFGFAFAPLAQAQTLARPSQPVTPFECAWRAIPTSVRVDLTRDMRSVQDLSNLGERLAGLTEEAALAAGRACNLNVERQDVAEMFGAYIGAKTIMVALGGRLQIEFGVHEGQLEIFGAALTPQQRRSMVREMMTGAVPSPVYLQAVQTGVMASGIDTDQVELVGLAIAYAMARATVEEIGAL